MGGTSTESVQDFGRQDAVIQQSGGDIVQVVFSFFAIAETASACARDARRHRRPVRCAARRRSCRGRAGAQHRRPPPSRSWTARLFFGSHADWQQARLPQLQGADDDFQAVIQHPARIRVVMVLGSGKALRQFGVAFQGILVQEGKLCAGERGALPGARRRILGASAFWPFGDASFCLFGNCRKRWRNSENMIFQESDIQKTFCG